jgi:hypothetical protein
MTLGGDTTRESAGQEKFPEIDCEAPLIVMVALQTCGPVPSGGGAPGVLTVNRHCVGGEFGMITALLPSVMLKLPVASAVTVVKPAIAQLVLVWPLQGGGTLGLVPPGTICASTRAPE